MTQSEALAIPDDLAYSVSDAKYAKGKMALSIPGIGGWKSTAACILTFEIAPNVRWSGRERAYIVSPNQVKRFEQAIDKVREQRRTQVENEEKEVTA